MGKPYRVAEIAYDPNNTEYPWYVLRTGTIAGQGGLEIGTESLSFQSLKDACSYVEGIVTKDLGVIKKLIADKEARQQAAMKILAENPPAALNSDCPLARPKDKGKHNWRGAMGDPTLCDNCHQWWDGIYPKDE